MIRISRSVATADAERWLALVAPGQRVAVEALPTVGEYTLSAALSAVYADANAENNSALRWLQTLRVGAAPDTRGFGLRLAQERTRTCSTGASSASRPLVEG
jgi:hypothetical protein